jgi:hypothetical protein
MIFSGSALRESISAIRLHEDALAPPSRRIVLRAGYSPLSDTARCEDVAPTESKPMPDFMEREDFA